MIIIGIPCLCLGGTEIATAAMVRALIGGGYTVRVCCYFEHAPEMVARYEAAGATVDLLELRRGGVGSLLAVLRAVRRYLQCHRPEVFHVQYMAPGLIPILAAQMAGVKQVYATVHAAGNRGYNWKAKLMFRTAAAMTTHFFCVSKNAERFWFGEGVDSRGGDRKSRQRHSTVYNGIEVERFASANPALIPGSEPGDLVVGIVGRVVALKGHDCLFRAAAMLRSEFPRLKILVIGEGPDRERFEQLAEALGIADRVVWMGSIEPEDLPGYYQSMHILAMPSHWEGFGLSAAEAMAAGKAVVGTCVPGLEEVIVNNVTGLLFPADNAEALADCLRKLLQDEALRRSMGGAGRDRVSRLFASDIINAQWLAAYASLSEEGQMGRKCPRSGESKMHEAAEFDILEERE
jgi:glycosyltransferase involved in cell wall biosynthesis